MQDSQNGTDNIQVNFTAHENAAALEDYLSKNSRVFVGVVFYDENKGEANFTYELRFPYNLRSVELNDTTRHTMTWNTGLLFKDIKANEPRVESTNTGSADEGYVTDGFVLMQNEITLNYIEMKANLTTPITRPMFRRIPHGKYFEDQFMDSGDFFIAFWIVISGFWSFSDVILTICTEKEKQIKEILIIAGLSNIMQWVAWFIVNCAKAVLIRAFILLMFCTRIANLPAILTFCNPFIYFLLQITYSINLLTLAFLISVIFKDPSSAVFFGRAIYFIFALPYFVAREYYYALPKSVLMMMSLLGHSGYGLGVHLIYLNEKKGEKSSFANLFESPDGLQDFNLGISLTMTFVGAIIHIISLLYIERIRPGKYGIPLKWYFPFTKSFWFPKKTDHIDEYEVQRGSNIAYFQPPDRIESRKEVMVFCDHLTKKFGNRTAIENVSLKLFAGQLVVILGFHNSGKTVLLSMLAGILKPTSGSIIINGYDLIKNPIVARKFISFVGKDNIIFQNLTLRQNIMFYCHLRGFSKWKTNHEIAKYVEMLGLVGYEDLLASSLVKIQQKKLSIVAALCGSTKVVFIDAPCSGADPRERSKIWQMLSSEKTGRTILVGTMHINEGERLADKVVILSSGSLSAFGTPLFIKETFGIGHLVVSVSIYFIYYYKGLFYKSKTGCTLFYFYGFASQEETNLMILYNHDESSDESGFVLTISRRKMKF